MFDIIFFCVCVFFQGFYQLLEPKVTIRCRKQDLALVQVSFNLHEPVRIDTDV